MSTSALASARRRRATNETQAVPVSGAPTTSPASATINAATRQGQVQGQQAQNQTLTPLQILQIHDIKLKELETLVMDFTDEDALSKFIDEKFDSLLPSKNVIGATTNSQTPSLYEEKIQMLEKNLEQKIELQNIKIDEFKASIRELLNNIKEDNNNIMKYINSNIQNQITSNNNLLNDKLAQNFEKVNNVDSIMREFNELKLLVIKSQAMSLEMSNSVTKLYEQCNSNSTKAKALEEDIALLHSKKHTNTSNIMLQSLLSGSLFKSNELKAFAFNADGGGDCGDCGDCANCDDGEEGEENGDLDEIKKLNIDFNNNEMLLSEEQIEDLLNITPANSNISIHEIITNGEEVISVEETVSKAEETVPQVEETVPQVEETVPQVEETVGKVEETVGKVEETVGKVEETVGKAEETLSKPEETETLSKPEETEP